MDSAIGGGSANTIAHNSASATIAGGAGNNVGASSEWSAIGGGEHNNIGDFSESAAIAGGRQNNIGTNSYFGAIGGGHENTIAHNSQAATIAGGWNNRASGPFATVAGGSYNSTTNEWTTISGGRDNLATKAYATVPGGRNNEAGGEDSFAAGRRAKAHGAGSFVWGDSKDFDVHAWGADQFVVRATGGYWLFSAVDGSGNPTAGVTLAAGSGSWTSISDRNAKEDFEPVNPLEVLNKVVALPVTTWRYKSQEPDVRHIGPVAQDFHAAFGVGESDTGITTVDADGVALAAIQGLNAKVESGKQKAEIRMEKLEAENAALKARLERLEQLLAQQLNQNTP